MFGPSEKVNNDVFTAFLLSFISQGQVISLLVQGEE